MPKDIMRWLEGKIRCDMQFITLFLIVSEYSFIKGICDKVSE